MKRKKAYVSIAMSALVVLLGIIMTVPAATSASANSAVRIYNGSTATGLIVTDEKCPIVVEHEDLHFDLMCTDEDEIYSALSGGDEKYTNTVSATYSFYNPADYDVHATLVFPFGSIPYYLDEKKYDDTELYEIELDGEPAEKTLRHTFIGDEYLYYEYQADRDLARLEEERGSDDYFNDDLVIYKYECRIHFDSDGDEAIMALDGLTYTADEDYAYYHYDYNTDPGFIVSDGAELTVYTFDAEETDISERANFYELERDEIGTNKPVDGSLEVESSERIALDDLLCAQWDESGNVSRTDWRNAVLDKIDLHSPNMSGLVAHWLFTIEKNELMRWYEYDLDIGAGERVINKVTVPVYPDIDYDYRPSRFTYRYLLSPATCWADFSDLEITVETPHYVIGSSLGEFEYTDDGVYKAAFKKLPSNELSLFTSASKKPSTDHTWSILIGGLVTLFILIGGGFFASVIAIIVVACKVSAERR